jgi:hypothetical protein
MKRVRAIVGLLSAVVGAAAAADLRYGHSDFVPTPEQPIGFCADGNSWFPGATPAVVEWWDGTPGWGKVVHRGGMGNQSPPFDESSYKEEEMRVLLDRTPKNILWKAPAPGWGDSQPVVVGKRLINTYWPHFVVCYETETGKELWRDELEWAFLPTLDAATHKTGPAPDPAQARKAQTLYELGHAMRHLSHNLRDFEGKSPGLPEVPLVNKAIERLGAWRRTLEQVWPAALPDLDYDLELAKRFVAGEYEVLGVSPERRAAERDAEKRIPQFGFYHYANNANGGRGLVPYVQKTFKLSLDGAWPGWKAYQIASPTSDGELVAVRFGEGQVAAYEVATGRRVWAWRDPRMNISWIQHACSPRIGRELVFLETFFSAKRQDGELQAIDKRTGAVRWTNSAGGWPSGYPSSTLLLPDLDDGKGGRLPVVFSVMGRILRQSDGKVLCDGLGKCGEHYTLRRGNLLILQAFMGNTATRPAAVRLRVVSPDQVVAEMVEAGLPVHLARCPTATTDTFLMADGAAGIDLATFRPVPYGASLDLGECRAPSIVGRLHISHAPNVFDNKFRPRRDGMCLQTFIVTELPRYPGAPTVELSRAGLLGGAEAPADLFFDKHLAGFDKMRQINPKKWCGRYGAHLGAFFGHRTGGVVPSGERIFIQSQCFLYCIGPAVKGTPRDDPKVVAGIRAESDPAKLAARLDETSACYRYEAVKRLGALKAALPTAVSERLAKLLTGDPYEEIRLAALLTLDACDPQGEAGWKAMVAQESVPCYGADINWGKPGHREQQERRKRLPLTFRPLGADGPALLARRWPAASTDPAQRRALLAVATTLGWRVEPMVETALALAQDPKPWRDDANSLRSLPAYFASIDAAADPAAAAVLLKAYPRDWTLCPTFARHLPKDRLAAWIEPIAVESSHPLHRQRIFEAWRAVGPSAVSSMERVAAAMAEQARKLEKDSGQQALRTGFAQAIRETIAEMKGKGRD